MAATSRRTKTSGTNDADKYAAAIRDIQASSIENKKCFECQQRGPTYVDMTIGSFVCTKCSGMLRGITPPHRIKSISMSTFTADEVEMIRGKGNVYCAKVWLGLHDGKLVGNDSESIRDFIIQKYEKKRYYVDPSTIRHSLGSTASTASSISQQSDGCNLVPLASSTFGSANGTTKGSEMIGTTIQLQLNSKKQNITATQFLPNSISRNSPAPVVSNLGLLTAPGSQSSASDTKPKITAPASSNSATTVNTNSNTIKQPSLAAYALPAPSKDPFAPSKDEKRASSGFPGVPSLPMPTMLSTSNRSSQNNAQNVSNQPPLAKKASSEFKADFANFDNMNFGDNNQFPVNSNSNASGDLSQVNFSSSGQKKSVEEKSASDRYAALKDLDDMFKSTVLSEAPANSNGASTGAAIFGSSPVPSHPIMPSTMGNTSDRTISTPSPVSKLSGGQMSEDQFKQTTQSDWTAMWPQESNNGGMTTTSTKNNFASDNNFSSSFSSSNKNFNSAFTTASNSKSPINPFTGSSNLAQLNTSPWPTTGSSPVQSTSNLNWPPNVNSNLNAGGNSFSTQPSAKPFGSNSASTENTNFADFGNVSTVPNTQQQQPLTTKSNFGSFPDPFGAAPNSNLHQQSENNNDLFANAPKPAFDQKNDIDKTIGMLTSDIFGNTDAATNNSTNKNGGQFDFGIDPWASTNASKDAFSTTTSNGNGWPASSNGADLKKDTNGSTNLFASSILPASKSTNPFL